MDVTYYIWQQGECNWEFLDVWVDEKQFRSVLVGLVLYAYSRIDEESSIERIAVLIYTSALFFIETDLLKMNLAMTTDVSGDLITR